MTTAEGLKWGKPTIEVRPIVSNPNTGDWIKLDTPVENTTKLNSTKGNKKEAKEEGGGLVGVRYLENNYTLEFELFAKGDKDKPIADENGIITTEYEVRITPENASLPGKQLDVVHFSIEDTFDAENGEKWKYTGDVLRPMSGKKVKPYHANALSLSPESLYFGSVADSVGKTVTVASTGNVTAAQTAESWCTVSKTGRTVTIKVTENTDATARVSVVAITADSKTSKLIVTQIPA